MNQAAAVLLSLLAAVLYALTSVLQQSAAASVPLERALRPGLILALARRPRWLAGNVAEVGAYVTQFLALRRGSLLLVQTVLVTGLLFALPLGAALDRRRFRAVDWLWAVVVVSALGVFLAVAVPSAGRGDASGRAWIAVLVAVGAVVAGLVIAGPRAPGPGRAARLGTACGALFGLDAALTKACGHLLDRGVGPLLASWEPYALAAFAAYGFLLAQSAFQAGPLEASLPALTIADPVVAAAIGGLAFHEHVAGGWAAVLAEVGSVAVMAAGVVALARSPRVAHAQPAPAAG